jgi:flagellar biosynthesis protein FlhB
VSGARTEAPTPRRLAEARRRGEVAHSRELTGAVVLAAGLAALAVAGPSLWRDAAGLVRAGLARALVAERITGAELGWVALEVARLSWPPVLAAGLAGGLTALVQTGGLFATAVVAPRLERLDPAAGLARLLSPGRLAAVWLGAAKAAAGGALLVHWLRSSAPALAALPRVAAPGSLLPILLQPLVGGLTVLLLLSGVFDALLARWRLRRSLRMSREEVVREQREDQGDPRLRQERRRRHQALLETSPVARATCVIVNPTHLAVALSHRRDLDEAPRVIAKGAGAAARRIRSEARRAGVPIVRDVALARALHRLAEVGDEIPEVLYDAAAAVLAHLYGAPGGGAP